MQILLAIIALSFLIIIHEFGHFIVAKLSGIKVLEFSLFMGPKIFSIQKGETAYSVRLIPLGGFVRMEGEEEASDDERAYNKKPVHIRAAVIAAGPLMNLFIALIIITGIFLITGFETTTLSTVAKDSPAYEAGLQKGDRIVGYDNKKVFHPMDVVMFLYSSKGEKAQVEVLRGKERIVKTLTPKVYPESERYLLGFTPAANDGKESNVVGSVGAGSPAYKAGLQANDRIIRLNEKEITTRQEINNYVNANKNKPIQVTVSRNGAEKVLKIAPMLQKIPEQYDVGIGFTSQKSGFAESLRQAVNYSISTTRSIYYSLIWLISGKVSAKQMMGPVGIVTVIGDVVQQSPSALDIILNLLRVTAFISINLGIFNLIPFPALDGSKILLLIIEAVRRKAIAPEKEAFITMIGFVLLIMLMIFTTSNDILRILGKG